ncbi:hypothetical protein L596_023344 [Steinernema carpocapsae]|uniref:Uncharacterized protein n=1 Tax=Steinernema carpocapsae TaxID=34508 RepID=A0A4U5MDE3_STECR|nr:hypothetical protein L596_023344 [Steinernema carpocapsae]
MTQNDDESFCGIASLKTAAQFLTILSFIFSTVLLTTILVLFHGVYYFWILIFTLTDLAASSAALYGIISGEGVFLIPFIVAKTISAAVVTIWHFVFFALLWVVNQDALLFCLFLLLDPRLLFLAVVWLFAIVMLWTSIVAAFRCHRNLADRCSTLPQYRRASDL